MMKKQFSHSQRILSLDVFRGLTIMLMILVNAPGNRTPYPILDHAPWNGGTLADLVFPFFLFIVGLTSVIVLNKQVKEVDKAILYKNILKRSLMLFALGLFINIFPYPLHIINLRYYGILQRIALCYCVCAFLYLNSSIKSQVLIFLAILLAYWFLMTQLPVPGFGANNLTESGSWVAYFDQLLFSPVHLLNKVYDPEGFLSTFPSIATTILGMLTGSLLLTPLSKAKQSYIMMGLGLIFLALSWVWAPYFPINKNLWTSSYVLWSGAYALLIFGFFFYIIDVLDYTKWTLPLKIFGMNALFIFVFHVLLLKLQAVFHFPLRNGTIETLRLVITDYFFGNFSPENAALLYAICFVFLNFLVALYLYKRKIFIRL